MQGGVFRRCRDAREVAADFLPAGPETVRAGQREAILRQVRGAEADEAKQLRLFAGRGGAAGLMQLFREPDSCNVVAGAGGPAAPKRAIRVQIKIRPGSGRGSARGNRNGTCVVMVQLLGSFGLGRIERPAKGGAVEQAERVLRGVGHGDDLLACAHGRRRAGGACGRRRYWWGLVAPVARPVSRAARSVFAGQHQGALVEIELEFIERKVGELDNLARDLSSGAIIGDRERCAIIGDRQCPDPELFCTDARCDLVRGDQIDQPVGTCLLGEVLDTWCADQTSRPMPISLDVSVKCASSRRIVSWSGRFSRGVVAVVVFMLCPFGLLSRRPGIAAAAGRARPGRSRRSRAACRTGPHALARGVEGRRTLAATGTRWQLHLIPSCKKSLCVAGLACAGLTLAFRNRNFGGTENRTQPGGWTDNAWARVLDFVITE